MLYLFGVKFDGSVTIKDFDSCVERSEFADSLDRAEYRHVIEIDGSFNYHPHVPYVSSDV